MKSFFRFLARNPLYALINMVGLAVSLMFVILIGDYAWRQFALDRWQRNHDRIVLMGCRSDYMSWADVSLPLKDMFPEVEDVCNTRTVNANITASDGRRFVHDEMSGGNVMLADTNFFRFFDYDILYGDSRAPLSSPDRCVISESLAQTLFPGGDAVGGTLRIAGDGGVAVSGQDVYDSTLVYTVSAVMEDFDHTVISNDVNLVASYERHPEIVGYINSTNIAAYDMGGPTRSFLLLSPGSEISSVEGRISDFVKERLGTAFGTPEVYFTPFDDLVFAPENSGRGFLSSDKGFFNVMLAAVLAILFFAVTNYVNLTVANTGFRSKEMATRRLLGSSGASIALKLVLESVLMVSMAFVIGTALAFAFEDSFEAMLKGKIALADDVSPGTVGICVLFVVLLGVLSGVIPSVQMSRFKPIDVVRGTFRYHSKMVLGRVFIVLQNVITLTLLTATLVIMLQIRFLVNAPMGFDSHNLVRISSYESSAVIADALRGLPCVKDIAFSQGTSLTGDMTSARILDDADGDKFYCYGMNVDTLYFRTTGIEVLKSYPDVSADGCYVNEAFLRRMDLVTDEDIRNSTAVGLPIAGVVSDFKMRNALENAAPFTISPVISDPAEASLIWVRTDGSRDALERIRQAVLSVGEEGWGYTEQDVYEWLVQDVDEMISQSLIEQHDLLRMLGVFTAVALMISVLGFIGMSLFFIRQRKKEIGLRKILGGTMREVSVLMLGKFCTPLLFSFVIAFPLSWWIMHRWLETFSTGIRLGVWIFLVTGLCTLLIALVSISFQIVRAVKSDPVESIKVE